MVDLIFSRFYDLHYDYLVTTVWSLGICVSAFGLELPAEQKLRLLGALNKQMDTPEGVPPTSYANIPSLVFSITCFFNQTDMNQLVTDTVERLSHIYGKQLLIHHVIVDNMLLRMDLLNCSSLLMGWGRCQMQNEELLTQVTEEVLSKHRQKIFYEEGALAEVANIIFSLQELHYRHDKLLDVLHSYVMRMRSKLNTYYIALILNAYASLAPDNARYLSDLGPELHEKLQAAVNTQSYKMGESLIAQVEELVPDITSYTNLWLSITCFGVKSNVIQEDQAQQATSDEAPEYKARGLV